MAQVRSTLLLDVRPGERLVIGDGLATVEVLHKSGRVVRLRLNAPRNVPVRKAGAANCLPGELGAQGEDASP